MNSFPVGSHKWNQALSACQKAARGTLSEMASPKEQTRQFEALRAFLCRSGVCVPGLSYAGIPVKESAADRLILIRFQDEPNSGRVSAWQDHAGLIHSLFSGRN